MSIKNKTFFALAFFLVIGFGLTGRAFASLPPQTAVELSGTLGQQNWYTSNVNVQLTSTDDLEGVASITYQLDQDGPVTTEFQSGPNPVLNPSFEECRFRWWFLCLGIKNWEAYSEGWAVLMWRSAESYAGGYSAAIGNFWGGETYWYNRSQSITVTPSTTYNFSVWVRIFVDDPSTEVGGEIWSKGASFAQDQKIAQTQIIQTTTDWTNLSVSFQVPPDTTEVYLRLRAQAISPLTVALFDAVSLTSEQDANLNFNVIDNGTHQLTFYAIDRAGNQESQKNTSFKIDTLSPGDWQNFDFQNGPNSHEFSSSIQVRDVTSGVDPTLAKYRYYTDYLSQGWSDWLSADSVTVVDTGLNASAGETRFVKVSTPVVAFGETATVYRFQFQIMDMAGSTSSSPIQTIEGPWLQTLNGTVIARAAIDFPVPAPLGKYNSNDLLTASSSISNYITNAGFTVTDYQDQNLNGQTLASIFPNYSNLRSQALPLPENKLPSGSGVYLYPGNFVIDAATLTPSFQRNTLAAIIFIDGNLRVKNSYSLSESSAVIYLVQGNVEIEGAVSTADGFFMSQGDFNSLIDGQGNGQLQVTGGVLSLGNVILSRDLGQGIQGNSEKPAEKFIFSPAFLLNADMASLIAGRTEKVKWFEASNE